MARNPALWIRVPNGGTPDNPAVYTAIRDSLREISEAVRLLQGGPAATASPTKTTTSAGAQYTNSGPNIYLPLAGGTMTGLLATVASATSSSGFRLPHGTAPSSPVNGDMWTTASGLFAYINGTTVGPFSAATGVYLPLAGGTMTGLLTTVASGTSSSGFNLPHGAAPTTPVNGDLWTTTTGIYARINGATVGPLIAGSYLPLAGGTMAGAINMNNFNITNINELSFNDPGAAEGINWLGGNLWRIYEAPNALTNAAGNLQFTRVIASVDTRLMTLDTSGNLDVIGALTLGTVLAVGEGGTGADLSATGGTGQYVKQATMGGAFTVGTIPASDIASGAALTRVNDTNVTLTLGGTPTTALLAATSLTLGWSGQLSIARGGTGQSTAIAAFDALSPLTTLGDIIYHNGTDNVRLAGNTTTTRLFLAQTGTGAVSAAPVWTNVAAADVVSGAALTKVDDTNVTLTLGGTPTSALLKATSLTLGWTGTLAQTRGGFGADISSVLANRVYASPNGAPGAPTFRALVAADIPSLSGTYLPLAGGTMSGNINMNSNDLTNVDGISATQVFIGAAVTGGNPFYAVNTDTTFTDAYRDLGFFSYTVSPSAAALTTQYTSLYASTTINSANTISNRVRAIWGEIFAQTAIADVSAVYGDITLTGTANTTNAIAVHAGAPVASSTGRITGYAAGVYIDAQTGGAVTGTAYGIYQASTSDKNILAGGVRIGSTTTPTNALDVTGTATVSANFAVDTSTLYVDSTNNRTGLGTTVPQTTLHVDLTGGALDTDLYNNTDAIFAVRNAGTGLRLVSATGTPTTIDNTPALVMLTARGTASAATVLSSGDYVGRILWQGIQSGGGRTGVAEIRAAADAAPGVSYVPGRIEFWTTSSTGVNTERVRIDDGGNFLVDTNVLYVDAVNNRVGVNMTPTVAFDVTGSAKITADLTVDTTTFFVDSTNNRIGVGTTTPSTLAHFFQSTTGDAQVRLNNNNAGTAAVMTYLLTNGSANAGLELTGASFTTYPSRLKLYNGAAGGVVMESDAAAGFFAVSVGATFPTGERMRVKGDVKALTNNTNTSVISLGLSAGSFAGATIIYTIEATDGTNHQCASGIVHVAIARNAAGTFATGQVSNTVTTTSATSGTLAITWAAPTGADPSLIQVNANSSLAVSAGYPRIRYTVFRNGSGTINIL